MQSRTWPRPCSLAASIWIFFFSDPPASPPLESGATPEFCPTPPSCFRRQPSSSPPPFFHFFFAIAARDVYQRSLEHAWAATTFCRLPRALCDTASRLDASDETPVTARATTLGALEHSRPLRAYDASRALMSLKGAAIRNCD